MLNPLNVVTKVPLYQGQPIPFDKLSPAEFENFVFSCFQVIADLHDLVIIGKPTGSGDGGFDIQGRNKQSGRIVCVQCKRISDPLGPPVVAKELAKIAAHTMLEGSDVGEHRFVCTSRINNNLAKQLRETPLQTLAVAAGKQLADAEGGELASLRARLLEIGADPTEVAESYVRKLDLLLAWGAAEFNAALAPSWEKVKQIADRYFIIQTVVRDDPRVEFDRIAYVAEHSKFNAFVEPRLSVAPLPEGIQISSTVGHNVIHAESEHRIDSLLALLSLNLGEIAVLTGDGGIGKSTALALLRAEAVRTLHVSPFPVLISLSNYDSNGLDWLIHQEMCVTSGTWRHLPDQVLLLCDGLNECSTSNINAFLVELKSLLKRRRVSCVLSTRAATKHRILLPQMPVVCVVLECITPVAVRRIAERHLDENSCNHFVAAYRALADTSGVLHLWTPFAVLTALTLWKNKSALPQTLGEMLQVLLQQRCARDTESQMSSPSADVILNLAGSLAFQCLIIDKRLGCPATDAGKWIREAKKNCVDALGIADMGEMEVVALLIHHEFLHSSANGYLSFGHQLLAGALAAPILARAWQLHTLSIGEPVADDAWVFAARMIRKEDLADFLEEMFAVDLMLGARAARELSVQFHALAEQSLFHAVAADVPELLFVRGVNALARLGSEGAIAKLRVLATSADSDEKYCAQLALARAGDLDYLRQLLPEVDEQTSGPIKFSGGNMSIWEAAPVPVRLDLARQRLAECRPGSPVTTSLLLIAYERDPNDADVIERHLRATSHWDASGPGFYALLQTSPMRAKAFFNEVLLVMTNPVARASLIRIVADAGLEIDLRMAFDCAISHLPENDAAFQASYILDKLISDVLKKETFPPDLVAVIERELPSSGGDRRGRLWQLASITPSEFIEEYAVTCIESWGKDLGQACNYFIAQPQLARARHQHLLELCERGLEKEETWYDLSTERALELVGELGFTSKAAASLAMMIQRLTRLRQANEGNNLAFLAPDDAKVLAAITSAHVGITLDEYAARITFAAAKAKNFLSCNIRLALLQFNMSHYTGAIQNLTKVLTDLNENEIDTVLIAISNPWVTLSGLAAACACSVTEIRINLLAIELARYYALPSALTLFVRILESCWDKEICDMVMRTVAKIEVWPEFEQQFFWSFFDMVAHRVTSNDTVAIEAALAVAHTPHAKRILGLWRAHAAETRLGMAMLADRRSQ